MEPTYTPHSFEPSLETQNYDQQLQDPCNKAPDPRSNGYHAENPTKCINANSSNNTGTSNLYTSPDYAPHDTESTSHDQICSSSTNSTPKYIPSNNAPAETSTSSRTTPILHTNTVKIGTINIQNAKSNYIYLAEQLKKHDILCIQEHWLYTFEETWLENVSDNHIYFSKSVDMNDPLPPTERRRGYGGVAIFWSKSLDNIIKPLPDGDNRITCIEINSETCKIIIINAYMPSRGRQDDDKYDETIAELKEIIYTYEPSHKIILIGDMNASLHRNPPNIQDKKFSAFCKDAKISPKANYPTEATFHHHNGQDRSTIDYILEINSNTLLNHIKVCDNDSLSVSDHKLVTAEITMSLKKQKNKLETIKQNKKVNWEKCNITLYRETLAKSIENTQIHTESMFDITQAIETFNLNIKQAENKACKKKNKKKGKKSKYRWTQEIAQASKIAKLAHYNWKKGGRPMTKTHPLFKERKETKLNLRRIQRQTSAIERIELYNQISTANAEHEQKLFYKLVNKQRNKATCTTDYITVENKNFSSHDDIIEGWQLHFEQLAKPQNPPKFNNIHKSEVENDILLIEALCKQSGQNVEKATEEEVRKIILSLKNNKAADMHGLTAEHLKVAISEVTGTITNIINAILEKEEVPNILKTGVLTPVLKKRKRQNKTRKL